MATMGNVTELLISTLALGARRRAAPSSIFGDPLELCEANGIIIHASKTTACGSLSIAASPRERGYQIATEISRELLGRFLLAPAAYDVARLASEILVHRPTLALIGEVEYLALAIHVPRRIVHAASLGASIYLV